MGAFWGSEDLEKNVQMLNPNPVSPNLEITLMRPCKDKDGDSWIKNLVPACPTPHQGGDCNDEDATINPGAADVCNGIDDDCKPVTEDGSGEQAPLNSKQQGICFETTQTCVSDNAGGANWQDNFPDNYNEMEQCDFVDHDCDGNPITYTIDGVITEIDCQIGGGAGLVGTPLGNTYTDGTELEQQILSFQDRWLLNKMQAALSNDACGVSPDFPCDSLWGSGTIHLCDNGLYFLVTDQGTVKVNLDGTTENVNIDEIIMNEVCVEE